MFELHSIPRFMENAIGSIVFFGCVWMIIFLLYCWLVRILYKFSFKKVRNAFEKIAPLDDKKKKKISRMVLICSILLPLMQFTGVVWIGVLRGEGRFPVFGVGFGYGIGFIQTIIAWGIVICCIKLIHLFHRTYCENDSCNPRSINAFVNILYVALVSFGAFSIMSVLTKERPIILMSTFGAVFAIFVFAFKNYLSALTASIQLNVERVVKVGDWITLSAHNIDGIVEAISARTIQVRNWDMSIASFPIHMLVDEPFCNYTSMMTAGGRQIRRALIVDQKSVRFLTQEEIHALKENNLLTDEILERVKSFDDTSKLAPCRLWTNLELFCLYADDYLARRKDIRHDLDCVMRALPPTGVGIPMEIYCYNTQTTLVKFEERQRVVVCHLLAVLPLFQLQVSQVNALKMEERHINGVLRQDASPNA